MTEAQYAAGRRCPKLLWHRWHAPEVALPANDEGRERAEVFRLAKGLFPEAHSVTQLDSLAALSPRPSPPVGKKEDPHEINRCLDEHVGATRAALRRRVPLWDTVFVHNGCCAQPDLLRPRKDGGWELIGIAASAGVPRSLLEKLAFQAHVLHGAEADLRRVLALHLNPRYVRRGPVEPGRLFHFAEVTQNVAELGRALPETIADQFAVLRRRDPPEPGLGAYCETPANCPLKARCWRELPEHNVFELHKIRREQAFALARAGKVSLNLLPEKLRATRHRQIQLTAVATGQAQVDRPALAAFLASLRYPLHCLDFETMAAAVPPFDGLHPWEMIPFQFSLHVVAAAGAPPAHYSFLSEGRSDPRPEILWRLRDWLGERGTILAYNAKFETGVLDSLARAFQEHRAWVAGIRPRFADLLAPFKAFAYYHPAQKGSASLKAVLPALTGRGYNDLAIREGNTAGAEYWRVTFGEATPDERRRVRGQLEAYCGRDTEGMVWILDALRRLTDEGAA